MRSWKSVLILLVVVAAANVLLYQVFSAYRYRWDVIHHTASPSDNYASIKQYHQKKHHWRDAGYHLILSNGSKDDPMTYLQKVESKQFELLNILLIILIYGFLTSGGCKRIFCSRIFSRDWTANFIMFFTEYAAQCSADESTGTNDYNPHYIVAS